MNNYLSCRDWCFRLVFRDLQFFSFNFESLLVLNETLRVKYHSLPFEGSIILSYIDY